MTFGECLREKRIEKRFLSCNSFAKHIGISATYGGDLEKNKTSPSLEMVYKIADGLKLNNEELYELANLAGYEIKRHSSEVKKEDNKDIFTMEDVMTELYKIKKELKEVRDKAEYNIDFPGSIRPSFDGKTKYPLIKNVRCGKVSSIVDIAEEEIVVPPTWAGKGDFCVMVSGDSMKEEGIFDGMVVLIKAKPVPDHGDIVLVYGYDMPEDISGVMKKAKYMSDNTLLLVNGSGQVIDKGERYEIIGKAVKWMTP